MTDQVSAVAADGNGLSGTAVGVVDGHAPVVITSSGVVVPFFDAARAEAAVRELLIAVGEDPDRDGLLNTPGRVARAYAE